MTVLAELGPHNWQDYSDFWRESDAEWLQARSLLRVDTFANLATTVTTPGIGQVVFVKDVAGFQKDVLYMYASEGGGVGVPGWKQYASFPKNLYASVDSNAQVLLGHHTGNPATSVPALSFSPTGLSVVSDLTVRTSVLKVTASNIQVKTGTKLVTLTTDTTALVSDSPIKAPGFTSTAATALTTLTATDITTTTFTSNGAAALKTTLTVTGAATALQYSTTGADAAGGLKAGLGHYWGSTNGAVIRRTDWQSGWPQLVVYSNIINMSGGSTQVDNQLQVLTNRPIEYWNSGNSAVIGYGGPVVVSASDPGGPNGTIWVQP